MQSTFSVVRDGTVLHLLIVGAKLQTKNSSLIGKVYFKLALTIITGYRPTEPMIV